MKPFVFVGPTLDEASARAVLDATYLPPAATGDVFRAALEGPPAIGIIDGFFERVPAVWHKEVLWALSRGIHVFGASSMGALRAAELHPFGMTGVGVIFEAFRSGELEDDDEVAVAHGDAQSGYRAASEALVNIRATLRAAETLGIVDRRLRECLENRAKREFYADRTYPALLGWAKAELGALPELDALRGFIADRPVNQKRADALEMLAALRACTDAGAPPPRVEFELANSEPWTQLKAWAASLPRLGSALEAEPAGLIAAEARCYGEKGRALFAHAFAQALSDSPTDQLSRERLLAELDEHVAAAAREAGIYGQLARRAADKRAVLGRHGFGDPDFAALGLPRSYVVDWYTNAIGVDSGTTPATSPRALHRIGLSETAQLEAEALREFLYKRLVSGPG